MIIYLLSKRFRTICFNLLLDVSMYFRFIFGPAYTHPEGTFGTYLCKFLTSEVTTLVGALCSIYTLVVISIERYYAVMKPLRCKERFTIKRFKLIAAACWIFATLWNVPLYIFSSYDENTKICIMAWAFKAFPKIHSITNVLVFGGILMGLTLSYRGLCGQVRGELSIPHLLYYLKW